MDIKEVIASFDSLDTKKFDERDVENRIQLHFKDSSESQSENTKFEYMAFGFCENYRNKETGWGTYFGPMFVWKEDNGGTFESPSIQAVSAQVIDYWTRRASEVVNPILKARYLGLVYDFKKKVTGQQPSIQIRKDYITALIDIANGEYYKVEVYTFDKLERALRIALSIKDESLISKCKDTLINYELRHGENNFPGLWGYCFDLLVGFKSITLLQEEEDLIITQLSNRFKSLLIDERDIKNCHPAAEHAGIRLAKYYKSKRRQGELDEVVTELCVAIENSIGRKSATQTAAQYNRIYKIYKKFSLNDQAGAILLKLRSVSPKTSSEMGVVRTQIDIPTDKLDAHIEDVTTGSGWQVLVKILVNYIVSKTQSEETLRNVAKKAPISYLFTKQIQDNKGRIVATIGSLEDDFEGNLIQHISRNLSFLGHFLNKILNEAIAKMTFNKSDILELLSSSPIFEEKRIPIIEKGLDAYFSKDYLVSVHLLVPQIEQALRNIVELSGGNVLRQVKDTDVFMLRTFEELLKDKAVIDVLGEDITLQYRVLFTDQRGWNIRNRVCHGIAEVDNFNPEMAGWVIHSLLGLIMVQGSDITT